MPDSRIRYIDALRGITMLLVVYAHVMRYSLEMRDVVSAFFSTFRMPTFFFISGFIAFKAVSAWSSSFFAARLRKKAIVQLVPAVVFFVAFALTHGQDPVEEFAGSGFGRYWFTVALFEMFCAYFALARLGNASRAWVTDVGLVALALAGAVYFLFFKHPLEPDVLLVNQVSDYFQFFVLGVLCREHSGRFLGAMSRRGVRIGVLVAFAADAVLWTLCWRAHVAHGSHAPLHRLWFCTVGAYVGVMAMFDLARSAAGWLDRRTPAADALCFVGRRTLDVYLLHYFFLPSLPAVAAWLTACGSAALNLAVALSIAAAVMALALLASRVIRLSPFLARWLFGAS